MQVLIEQGLTEDDPGDELHASSDYVAGVVHFKNGLRGINDCGAGAPDVAEVP